MEPMDILDSDMACPLCDGGMIEAETGRCSVCGKKLSEIAREYEQEQRDSHNTRHQ